MAAFCATCGKPIAADGRFCGGCGAPNSTSSVQSGAAPPPASPVVQGAPVASGASALKIILLIVVIGGLGLMVAGAGAFFYGRKKLAEWRGDKGTAASAPRSAASTWHGRSREAEGGALLTKEEVSAIIGRPVTEMEVTGASNAHYKTATPGFEATIEIEHKDDGADATQALEAARTVTKHMAGGKGDSVAGVGDDALYGAFNVLYMRKNDLFFTIMPPNLQQVAQSEQMTSALSMPMGSDAQRAALEKMSKGMQGDPIAASLSKPDAMSGAVDLIRHSASERGDEYETKARLMARQMAEKVLSKIGS